MQEFQKNKGTIDESTVQSLLSSGDARMVALLGDKNNLLQKGNDLVKEYSGLRDTELQKAVQSATGDANATKSATDSKSESYQTDVANKANSEQQKIGIVMGMLNDLAQATGKTVEEVAKQYGIDLNNKTNSENSKGSVVYQLLNALASATGQNIDQLGRQYGVDAQNFANAQSSKLKSYNEFVNQIEQSAMGISSTDSSGLVTGIDADPFDMWKAGNQLKNPQSEYDKYIGNWKVKQREQYKPVGTNVGSSYSPVSVGYDPVGVGNVSGSGSGSGGSGKGSSKATEKQVADLESLVDRYYRLQNVIDLITSTIGKYESAMKNAHGQEYVNDINAEIEAYKQKQQAIRDNINEMNNERWDLRVKLDASGFKFDDNWNINGNYAGQLEALRNQANSLSGDAKENAIKRVKDLSEATKKYAELCFNKIPKAEQEWQDLSNTIQDTYKKMEEAVASQEKKTYDVIKYYAEKATKTKQNEIDKQIEQINKLYSDEDKESDLNSKKKQLAELKSEMDKFEFSTDKLGQSKFKQLQDQYKQLEEDMNKTIRDNQKEATLEGMNKEKDALSKALEDYLKPENVNKIIEDGLRNGMINIMGSVVDLQNVNAQMLKETEVGYMNVNSQIKEWADNLKTVIAMSGQMGNIASNLGFNIDRSVSTAIPTNGLSVNNLETSNVSGINISMPLTVQGNVDNDSLQKVQLMINSAINTVKTEINNKLNLR